VAPPRSSAGDPARTLALLWRHEVAGPAARRGPAPGLDVDAVVEAALGIADEVGVEALTMRAVATRLGVSAMSLYTYVPGKAELLDCVIDHVHAGLDRRPPTAPGWRGAAEAVARDEWALHLAHPWLARVATTRPVLGPGAMAAYEHGLHAFEGTALPDVDRDAALTLLLGFVRECARLHADALDAAAASGTDDTRWWEQVSPHLLTVMGPERYPLASRVGTAAGQAHGGAYDASHAFEWGLPRVLDGLEQLALHHTR
jgi:AcrR family transcriptional regulator